MRRIPNLARQAPARGSFPHRIAQPLHNHLNDVKVLIMPQDARMRKLISLRAFGMREIEAARMYLALKMADKGLVSAPNAAAGAPFQIGGGTLGTFDAGALAGVKG